MTRKQKAETEVMDIHAYDPAFPPHPSSSYSGLTLLDYFAGQVLLGQLADPDFVPDPHGTTRRRVQDAVIAQYCYDRAEAMLTERARRTHASGNE